MPSVEPNVDTKSFHVANVIGTNAGPLTEVPTMPAGTPDGASFVGPVRSISRVLMPGLLKVSSAIELSPGILFYKYISLFEAYATIGYNEVNRYKFNCSCWNYDDSTI